MCGARTAHKTLQTYISGGSVYIYYMGDPRRNLWVVLNNIYAPNINHGDDDDVANILFHAEFIYNTILLHRAPA